MGVDCEMCVALRCGLSACACIMRKCVHTSTWCGLGLARNVSSVIGDVPVDNL